MRELAKEEALFLSPSIGIEGEEEEEEIWNQKVEKQEQ